MRPGRRRHQRAQSPRRRPLEGYDAVRAYLARQGVERCDKTVRLWAKEGMPVYKLRGRVLASPDAIDLWLRVQRVHVAARGVGG